MIIILVFIFPQPSWAGPVFQTGASSWAVEMRPYHLFSTCTRAESADASFSAASPVPEAMDRMISAESRSPANENQSLQSDVQRPEPDAASSERFGAKAGEKETKEEREVQEQKDREQAPMGGEAREVQNPEQTADEKDEDNENEEDLLSQEKQKQFLSILQEVYEADAAGTLEERLPEIKERFLLLGGLKDLRSFDAMKNLQGIELTSSIRALMLLGLSVDPDAVIPVASASLLIDYFASFTDSKRMRGGLAILRLSLPDDEMSRRSFCQTLHCGKNRVDRALAELETSGLIHDKDGTNEPGAGRPSLNDLMTDELLPYLISALPLSEEEICSKLKEIGLSPESSNETGENSEASACTEEGAVDQKDEQNIPSGMEVQTAGMAKPGASEAVPNGTDGKDGKDGMDGEKTDPDKNADPDKDAESDRKEDQKLDTIPTLEQLSQALDKLKASASGAHLKLEEAASNNSTGNTRYLLNWETYLKDRISSFDEAMKTIRAIKAIDSGEGVSSPFLLDLSSDLELLLKDRKVFTYLLAQKLSFLHLKKSIDALRVSCDDLINIIESTGQSSECDDLRTLAWRQIRACEKEVPYKRCKRIVDRSFSAYEQALEGAEDIIEGILSCTDVLKSCRDAAVSGENQRSIDLDLLCKNAQEALTSLLRIVRKECPSPEERIIRKGNARIREALSFLEEVQGNMDQIEPELQNQDREVRCSIEIMLISISCRLSAWAERLQEENVSHAKVREVCVEICCRHNQNTIRRCYREAITTIQAQSSRQKQDADEKDPAGRSSSGSSGKTCTEKESVLADETPSEEDIRSAEKGIQELQDAFQTFAEALLAGKAAQKVRANSKPDRIMDAVEFLKKEAAHLKEATQDEGWRNDARLCNARIELARNLLRTLKERLKRLENRGKGDGSASYSSAKSEADSMMKKPFARVYESAWKKYNNDIQKEDMDDTFISVDSFTEAEAVYRSGGRLSHSARRALVCKFWYEGKNPLDPAVWIDYIVEMEGKDYGSPEDGVRCCRITQKQLQGLFQFLTGVEASATALWDIFKKKMGYTSRQCLKLDQVGKPHPEGEKQKNYIESILKQYDLKKTLVLSVDVKAFIILGRLKHDNGVLMCSADGHIYHVYDHDFAFTLREIYKNIKTDLVGEDRMDEKAVIRPAGAYCLNDKSGWVSLVVGKDTADSMAALLRKVISVKKKEMPELEKAVILADGGGSNMAGGIQWTAAMNKVVEDVHLDMTIHHYSPGASRHNPIEHRLWGPMSTYWKGRPFLTIEHVMKYTVDAASFNAGLTSITCWFDRKRYKTNVEKKKAGEHVMTRAELDKLMEGRIIHYHEKDSALYKWNYTILCKKQASA
jgi:hypothetical protein